MVSSGKLYAPSMASDGLFRENHCSNASVCGWYVNPSIVTGNPALAKTSTGSPVSRLLWQCVAEPGNTSFGVALINEWVIHPF
jgi:hypothetical protein